MGAHPGTHRPWSRRHTRLRHLAHNTRSHSGALTGRPQRLQCAVRRGLRVIRHHLVCVESGLYGRTVNGQPGEPGGRKRECYVRHAITQPGWPAGVGNHMPPSGAYRAGTLCTQRKCSTNSRRSMSAARQCVQSCRGWGGICRPSPTRSKHPHGTGQSSQYVCPHFRHSCAKCLVTCLPPRWPHQSSRLRPRAERTGRERPAAYRPA